MKAIDRVYEYIDFKGIKATPFERKIGLSNGYLGKQLSRSADLGEGVLIKIIENCPEIAPEWLLTGKGSMLKSEAIPVAIVKKEDLGKIVILERDNERLKETNDLLRFKVSTLEKELTEFRYNSQKEPVLYKSVAESAPELIKKESK